MNSLSGRFAWRELVTPDPAAVIGFYRDLFGWSSRPVEGMSYTLLRNDTLGEDVGGVVAPAKQGIPSHWLDYITVDDVDAALARVAALGGTVVVPAMSIPGIGRFGIAKDPDGAVFAPFRGESPGATDTERRPPVGTFCWSQLMTNNLDRVVPFYAEVFGWTPGVMGGVTTFAVGETPRATAMTLPMPDVPSHWVQYVAVEDADVSFAKARSLGAGVLVPPSDIPGMGRYAVLTDPVGTVLALWKQVE